MRYVPLYVLTVQVCFTVVIEPCYSVYAVKIVYPSTVTLFRNKVITVVDVFGKYTVMYLASAYSVNVVSKRRIV